MVASKTDLFEKEFQQRTCMFRVLAHPARIQMIQHLQKLKNAGIISYNNPYKCVQQD